MTSFTIVICASYLQLLAEDIEVRKGWSMLATLTLTAETVRGIYVHKLLCLNLRSRDF